MASGEEEVNYTAVAGNTDTNDTCMITEDSVPVPTIASEETTHTDAMTEPEEATICTESKDTISQEGIIETITENIADEPLEQKAIQTVESVKSAEAVEPVTEAIEAQEVETVDPELLKYWKAVQENPADFTGWTYLLQYVEQENRLKPAREAFSAFLARYPYCYGYWKKFADLEKRHDNSDKVREVFENGVAAIPLSIDLWIHYIDYTISSTKDQDGGEHLIRALYERAVQAAGWDFRSDKLWDRYVNWEISLERPSNVTAVFDKVLQIPTQLYTQHYEDLSNFLEHHSPKESLSVDEFLELRKYLAKSLSEKIEGAASSKVSTDKDKAAEVPAVDQEKVDGEKEVPPGVDECPPGLETVDTKESIDSVADEEIAKIKELALERRRLAHKQNEEEVAKRWHYEEAIRRPYFHVKPLEKVQLRNWREYLDYEAQYGTPERTVFLFERCLIACALYEEFWLKYAQYLEKQEQDPNLIRAIYQRGCYIHLPKKPTIHLAWAAFEEKNGSFDMAMKILKRLDENAPGLVLVTVRMINLARRSGDKDQVNKLYEACLVGAKNTAEYNFYALKYSRYLSKCCQNYDEARELLEKALVKDPVNTRLLLQLIDVEYTRPVIVESKLISAFDLCLAEQVPLAQRFSFSQRKLEILEELGSSVTSVIAAQEDHQKLMKDYGSVKKRKAESVLETELFDRGDHKKMKADIASTPATSSIPSTANGSMMDYSQMPPSDPSAYYNAYNTYAQPQGYGHQHPYYNWGGGYSGYY